MYHLNKDLTNNKAKFVIRSSLLSQGFCVNHAGSLMVPRDWNCNRAQSRWSNSHHSGVDGNTTKSKGRPSFISNAGTTATDMTNYNIIPAGGNPLNPTNYTQNYKWGTLLENKWGSWTSGISNSDEKGWNYEGE